MKSILFTVCLGTSFFVYSQNVGIGTAIPSTKLYVVGPDAGASNTNVTIESPGNAATAGLKLTTGIQSADLIRYGSSSPISTFGIPGANLMRLFNAGPILIGSGSANHLYFGTNNTVRMNIDGTTGFIGVGVDAVSHAQMIVKKTNNVSFGYAGPTSGAIYAESGSTNEGSGLFAVTGAPKTGSLSFAGVTGINASSMTDRFGVVGVTNGTSTLTEMSAGVGGYGDYGVLGFSQTSTGAGIMAQHNNGGNALELNNGYVKVSGTNKTAFVHIATSSNTGAGANSTILNYANQAANDILLLTSNWNPGGNGGTYNVNPIGVYWTGSAWGIFNQNGVAMPLDSAYNVMVIKQ